MKAEVTKEMFCDAIDAIENHWLRLNKLEDALGVEFGESSLATDLMDNYLRFICDLMGVEDNVLYSDDISYYCWEIGFGKKWESGMVTDENGKDIPMRNAEDLWNIVSKTEEVK